MDEVAFHVVEIDGVLADVRPIFNALATAVVDRPVEVGELHPPHTIGRLAEAAGLSEKETGDVQATIRDLRDFWLSVPPVGMGWRPVPRNNLVFHARRVPTAGKPVLIQTIEWLNKHGYKNPIVWIEEEE